MAAGVNLISRQWDVECEKNVNFETTLIKETRTRGNVCLMLKNRVHFPLMVIIMIHVENSCQN